MSHQDMRESPIISNLHIETRLHVDRQLNHILYICESIVGEYQ